MIRDTVVFFAFCRFARSRSISATPTRPLGTKAILQSVLTRNAISTTSEPKRYVGSHQKPSRPVDFPEKTFCGPSVEESFCDDGKTGGHLRQKQPSTQARAEDAVTKASLVPFGERAVLAQDTHGA